MQSCLEIIPDYSAEEMINMDQLNETCRSCTHKKCKEKNIFMRGILPLNSREDNELVKELLTLIEGNNFSTLYQPIVSLKDGDTIGYEALSRGPITSKLHMPDILFPLAIKNGCLFNLENATRQLAINRFTNMPPDMKLFLNFNPETIKDPCFSAGRTKELLEKIGLAPQNIVWEITERTAISDFDSFIRSLEHYRNQGYMIAIDDAGAGYSSLQSIAEIRPDFIKMDMSLISGVAQNPIKKIMLETFVTFAERINSTLIAEGIENEEDLRIVIRCGIPLAQGFFLGRPKFPPQQVQSQAMMIISETHLDECNFYNPDGITAQALTGQTLTCSRGETMKTIVEKLNSNNSINSVVVLENKRPIGLIMKERLLRQIASKYGYSLYGEKQISTMMDYSPLKIESNSSLLMLAEYCRNRPGTQLYDDIIIVKNGNYEGIVQMRQVFDALTQVRLEVAKISNPMTNLPGSPLINNHLSNMIRRGKDFAAIYADLDNFKAVNDRYGFEKGDDIIRMTAATIKSCVEKKSHDNFIGHIGGDDFVFIVDIKKADEICQDIISTFDESIINYYKPQDIKKGGFHSTNRNGENQFFPICSISLSMVINSDNHYSNHLEITGIFADLKKYAKSIPGSILVCDRRQTNIVKNTTT